MHGGDFDFEDDDQDDCVCNEEEEGGVTYPKNQADLGEDQLESPDVHIVDIFDVSDVHIVHIFFVFDVDINLMLTWLMFPTQSLP